MKRPVLKGWRALPANARFGLLAAIFFFVLPIVAKFAPWALLAGPELAVVASWAFEITVAVDVLGAALLARLAWDQALFPVVAPFLKLSGLSASGIDRFIYHVFVLRELVRSTFVWGMAAIGSFGVVALALKIIIVGHT